MPKEREPRPERMREPDYTWGEGGTPPTVLWEHAAHPLVAQRAGGGVLLFERDRWLCRAAADGAARWETAAPGLPDDLAHDADGVVLALARELRELDPATGGSRWKCGLPGPADALALDPVLALAAGEGWLAAVSRVDGSLAWRARAGDSGWLAGCPEAGLVLALGADEGTLTAWDRRTGRERWQREGVAALGPAAAGAVWVSAHDEGVLGLELADGAVRAHLHTGCSFEAPGVNAGPVLAFTDGSVHALDPATGVTAWQWELQDENDGIFALRPLADLLLAETWRGRLLALSPADGARRWECRPGQVHGVTADERRLYLRGTLPGTPEAWAVLALDRADGAPVWELRARRLVADLSLSDGVLVVELRGRVVALAAECSPLAPPVEVST